MSKLNLNNITLIAVAGVRAEETFKALQYSCKNIEFAEKRLITYKDIPNEDGIDVLVLPVMSNMNYEAYNKFIIYDLHKYINTEFILLIQDDGFVINADKWQNEFLNWDYIGAPWFIPEDNFSYVDINGVRQRVGNGGFSFRSKRLLKLASDLNLPWQSFHGYYNEDGFICVNNRHIYDEHKMKIAPLDVAKYFSHEADIEEIQGIIPFGFHGKKEKYLSLLR